MSLTLISLAQSAIANSMLIVAIFPQVAKVREASNLVRQIVVAASIVISEVTS